MSENDYESYFNMCMAYLDIGEISTKNENNTGEYQNAVAYQLYHALELFVKYLILKKTGNVKKVNFGHGGTSAKKAGQKTMKIKKSNPARRKSFRARHKCATAKDVFSARYWSCKKW